MRKEETDVGRIKIDPIPFIEINAMDIIKKINCHTYLTAEGKIDDAEIKNLEVLYSFGTEIVVKESDKTIIFRGLLTELEIEGHGEVYTIKLRASSHTILLDRQKRTRPFHDSNKTVKELIQLVTDEYPKANAIINEKCNTNTAQFIMQYEETDWEFMIRAASICGQGVFPNSTLDYPAYYIGKPKITVETEIEDNIPLTLLKQSYTNHFTYQIKVNDPVIELSEGVIFKGMEFYVKSSGIRLEHALLNYYYDLCSKGEQDIVRIYNKNIAGKSVFGIVSKIERDQVYTKVLTEDGNGNGEGHWFPYSTVYASSDGSGWFCMPEPGDKVRVQFPDADEKNAYAVSSVSEYQPDHTAADRMRDYTKRYIRNKQGMEVMWTPDRVTISSGGSCLVEINQNGTLSLSAESKIALQSGNDIHIDAGNQIHINGGGGVSINCGAKAEINMTQDGIVELKGNEVYTN